MNFFQRFQRSRAITNSKLNLFVTTKILVCPNSATLFFELWLKHPICKSYNFVPSWSFWANVFLLEWPRLELTISWKKFGVITFVGLVRAANPNPKMKETQIQRDVICLSGSPQIVFCTFPPGNGSFSSRTRLLPVTDTR